MAQENFKLPIQPFLTYRASSGSGGAIHVTQALINSSVHIHLNIINIIIDITIKVTQCTLINNKASGDGGAIYMKRVTRTNSNTLVTVLSTTQQVEAVEQCTKPEAMTALW